MWSAQAVLAHLRQHGCRIPRIDISALSYKMTKYHAKGTGKLCGFGYALGDTEVTAQFLIVVGFRSASEKPTTGE
jgi:hypothetical protein